MSSSIFTVLMLGIKPMVWCLLYKCFAVELSHHPYFLLSCFWLYCFNFQLLKFTQIHAKIKSNQLLYVGTICIIFSVLGFRSLSNILFDISSIIHRNDLRMLSLNIKNPMNQHATLTLPEKCKIHNLKHIEVDFFFPETHLIMYSFHIIIYK